MLLKDADEKQLQEFYNEVVLLMNTVKNLDYEYAEGKSEFIHDFVHFKKFIKAWNKKYPHLQLEHFEDGLQLKLKIIIKEKDMATLISNALKIDNILKINGREVPANKSISFKIGKHVELTYLLDEEENSVSFVQEDNGISIIYSPGDMLKKDTPEFEICAYYALKEVNPDNLLIYSNYFSFDTDFEAREGRGIGYLNRVRLFDKI